MGSGRFLIGVLLALLLGVAVQAGGQSPPPPCPGGVAAQPDFEASDLDESLSPTLVATHSIRVDVFVPGAYDDVHVSIPGIDGTARPGGLTFFSDTPGPVTVDASWTQSDGVSATCAATASTTLQLIAPTPIGRFKSRDYGVKINFKYALNWIFGVDLGPTADHRPILVQWRGWRHPKLPDASVPFKTLTVPLRHADPGYHDLPRRLPLPRILFQLSAASDIVAVHVDSITSTHHPRPVAYDIEVSQAGRLLARFRLAGECSAFNCQMRTVKVQR